MQKRLGFFIIIGGVTLLAIFAFFRQRQVEPTHPLSAPVATIPAAAPADPSPSPTAPVAGAAVAKTLPNAELYDEKFASFFGKGANGLPAAGAEEAMRKSKIRLNSAFESPNGAAEYLKDLEVCMDQAEKMNVESMQNSGQMPGGLTPEMKIQVAQLPLQMQAGCLATAQKIAAKFPSLRNDVQKRIVSKAKPEAVRLARQMNAKAN